MINIKRGAGTWFAYDLKAVSPSGKKFKQGYYSDEHEVLLVDKETLEKLGYTSIEVTERAWHKKGMRTY